MWWKRAIAERRKLRTAKFYSFIVLQVAATSCGKRYVQDNKYILKCRVERDHLANSSSCEAAFDAVDLRRLELTTSSLQMKCSTS